MAAKSITARRSNNRPHPEDVKSVVPSQYAQLLFFSTTHPVTTNPANAAMLFGPWHRSTRSSLRAQRCSFVFIYVVARYEITHLLGR